MNQQMQILAKSLENQYGSLSISLLMRKLKVTETFAINLIKKIKENEK